MKSENSKPYDYARLFLHDVPMLDVRAPIEFSKGAFPCSDNRPLMDDEQRAAIGTCYTKQGQDAAVTLGHELINGALKQSRITSWQDFIQQHPEGMLYCFRGGMRSQITQQWLQAAGTDFDFVPGGYKAMRRFLIDNLSQTCEPAANGGTPLRLISGRTGSGKTRVLYQLHRQVDLEGRANHRGSAFGRMPGGQPSQINFENQVSIDFLKHRANSTGSPIYIEDESRLVGSCYVPDCLQDAMKRSAMIVLEASTQARTQLTVDDYVTNYWPILQAEYGELAAEKFSEQFLGSLSRIKKRLGAERYTYIEGLFQSAISAFLEHGDADGFSEGFGLLLTQYYDPMYNYMLEKRQGDVIFRGSAEEVIEFANKNSQV